RRIYNDHGLCEGGFRRVGLKRGSGVHRLCLSPQGLYDHKQLVVWLHSFYRC
ncbi:hypothetical protein EV182_003453, partial [Spiromyces aspiralis]